MHPSQAPHPAERIYVTDAGRQAIVASELCVCDVKLHGITLMCPDCGTLYGYIRDAKRPRAQKWNVGRRR